MQISSVITPIPQKRTNFKSATPCYLYILKEGQKLEEAVPATTKEINKCRQKIVLFINNSLPRGVDTKRDKYIDGLRKFIAEFIPDFYNKQKNNTSGRITTYFDKHGGIKDNKLFPSLYLISGSTYETIKILDDAIINAKKWAGKKNTPELQIANGNYKQYGKKAVRESMNYKGVAMVVFLKKVSNKKGTIDKYKFMDWRFVQSNIKDPSRTLTV